MSLKEAIRDANLKAMELVPVEIPEWQQTVYIKCLNVGERLAMFDCTVEDRNLYVLAVVHCVVNEKGERIWGNEDISEVAAMPGDVVLKLGNLAARTNRLLEPIKDAKKNLETTVSGQPFTVIA